MIVEPVVDDEPVIVEPVIDDEPVIDEPVIDEPELIEEEIVGGPDSIPDFLKEDDEVREPEYVPIEPLANESVVGDYVI